MDSIFNSYLYKEMLLYMVLALIMNYPSLYGHVYTENANSPLVDPEIEFVTNDLLLALMVFFRYHFFVRVVLSISFYTDPRSQRVFLIFPNSFLGV